MTGRAFAEFMGGPNDGLGQWALPLGVDGMPPTVMTFVTAPDAGSLSVDLAPPPERLARYVRALKPRSDGVWLYTFAPEPPAGGVP